MLPFHPRLVHFPIALLVTGVVLVLLHLWRREPWHGISFERTGFASLVLGWLTIVPAVITGLIDQNAIAIDAPARNVSNMHITAIVVTWIVFGLAIYLRIRRRQIMDDPRSRWLYIGLLLAGLAGLLVAGELGGQLTYLFGVGQV